ncbi:MAG: tetratricopeptide repeat protein [Bacteroidetes bacterium]|nr:tetratricopeptide repeat protein [Bacteroidota bacterium]
MSQFLSRAEILLEQGRFADAEKEIKKHLSEFPEHAHAIGLLARIYLQSEKYDEAMSTIDDAIRLDASEGYYYYIKAVIFLHKKDEAKAEMHIGFAVNAEPANAEYFATWADIKMVQKKYSEALTKADEGLSRDPSNVHCLNTRASALVKLNNKKDAYSTIEGALNEDPDNPHTHANYGWGLLEKGDHQKALIHFREALRLDPTMEYARAGMVEAMKAKYIIYRWFLNYQFWMSKQSKNMQWGIIIGIYVLTRILRAVEESNPEWSPYIFPIIIFIAMFAFLTWVIHPLSNLFLRLNKYGRYALDATETRISNFVGIAAAVFALGLVAYLLTFTEAFLALTIYGFTMMVPLSRIYSGNEHEKKFNYYALGMALVGALAIVEIFRTGQMVNTLSTVYFIGFAVFQWVANYWSQSRY